MPGVHSLDCVGQLMDQFQLRLLQDGAFSSKLQLRVPHAGQLAPEITEGRATPGTECRV